nr:TniQ family protein [Pseudoxanthomonas sp. PXM01]
MVATPLPNDRETAIGYVLRLTQANGYRSPTMFMPKGESAYFINRGGSEQMLQTVAGLTAEQAQRLAITKEPEGYRVMGQLLKARELLLDHHRICPACVEEDGIFDASWHLRCMSHCAKHGLPLIDHCEVCHKGLSMARPGVGVCRCQWLLMCNERPEPCSHQLRAVMQGIRSRLFENRTVAQPTRALPHFEGLDLGSFLTLIRALHKHVAVQQGLTIGERRMREEIMEVVARAMHAFKKGLGAVQAILQDGKALVPGKGPGSQKAYNWYYDHQYDLRSIPELAFIGEAIAAAGRGESDQFVISPKPALEADSRPDVTTKKRERRDWEREWVRLEDLATQTGCSLSGLQQAIDLKFIRGGTKRPGIAVLHRNELDRLVPSQHAGLSAEHAAGFLGVTPKLLEWLFASQNLPSVHIPVSGGPYAVEDVTKARALFHAARGRVLTGSPRMTLASFLNAAPHVQLANAHRVIKAIAGHDPLWAEQPPRGKALASRFWREAFLEKLASEETAEAAEGSQTAPALDAEELVSTDLLQAMADQLCRENLAKRLRRRSLD